MKDTTRNYFKYPNNNEIILAWNIILHLQEKLMKENYMVEDLLT